MKPRPAWVLVAFLALVLPCACGPGAAGWPAGWAARAAPARLGDAWVLVTREATPRGVRETRETWTLLDTLSRQGRFRVEREGRPEWIGWRPLQAHAAGAVDRGPVRRPNRDESIRVESVGVPAGRFRCGCTWRSYEEHEGRVMRVDEWWAPNVPVPVQRWTRWEGHASGALRAPPRRPDALVMGAEWTALERAPRR